MKNPKGIIISPSPEEVQKYLLKWDNSGNYVVQEEALDDLFMKTYPNNTDIKQTIKDSDNILKAIFILVKNSKKIKKEDTKYESSRFNTKYNGNNA